MQNNANGHIVFSRTGSQQGCNFGTTLWGAGWQDALEDFQQRTGFSVSYVDDGSFGLDAEAAAAFLEYVDTVAAAHGGELNYSKCTVMCSEVLPCELRTLGVRCIDPLLPAVERGVKLQGVPLGTEEYTAHWLDEHLTRQEEIMRRLQTYVPDRLAAAQILSMCVVPRISHILRALPPSASSVFARRFDDACVRCFTAIAAPDYASTQLPPIANTIMRLKLRDGGFDVGGQHRICGAAYVASWAAARPLILRLLPALAPHLPVMPAEVKRQ